MIIVEEDQEEAHVLACRLPLFVKARANLARWRLARARVAVDSNEPKLLDGLGLTVFEELEIGLGQIQDRLLIPVADDHVDAHEVDPRAKGGL